MVTVHKRSSLLVVLFVLIALAAQQSQGATSTGIIDQVQMKMAKYLQNLADVHCTESVTQEKLAPNGHIELKEQAVYDYLIMMQGGADDFELNETRVAASAEKPKTAPASMLVSNGIATALLVFHPYYRDSFKFDIGASEMVDGEQLIPIHFEPIDGRRAPAALALRGREYPLALKGTVWVDSKSAEVVRVDAGLAKDMSDIGLHAMHIHVEYHPVHLGAAIPAVDLPATAVVDVTTAKQHWRNTHVFSAYKSFSIDTEQDPAVKVHSADATDGKNNTQASIPAGSAEKR